MTRAQQQAWGRIQVVVITPLVVTAFAVTGALVGTAFGLFAGIAAAFAEIRHEWRRA